MRWCQVELTVMPRRSAWEPLQRPPEPGECGRQQKPARWGTSLYGRSVALFGDFPQPAMESGPWHLARLTMQLGMDALEESWQLVTGSPLPANVRDHVESWSGQ
jgi:hypothetical protein